MHVARLSVGTAIGVLGAVSSLGASSAIADDGPQLAGELRAAYAALVDEQAPLFAGRIAGTQDPDDWVYAASTKCRRGWQSSFGRATVLRTSAGRARLTLTRRSGLGEEVAFVLRDPDDPQGRAMTYDDPRNVRFGVSCRSVVDSRVCAQLSIIRSRTKPGGYRETYWDRFGSKQSCFPAWRPRPALAAIPTTSASVPESRVDEVTLAVPRDPTVAKKVRVTLVLDETDRLRPFADRWRLVSSKHLPARGRSVSWMPSKSGFPNTLRAGRADGYPKGE